MSSGLAGELRQLIESSEARLRGLSQSEVETPPRPGAWCKLEILGHLIDSASNNHQRFVRAQGAGELRFPTYEQEAWVARQDYRSSRWEELVDLWVAYNRHLAHVIERLPAEALDTPCRPDTPPGAEAMPLDALVADYLAHVRHHLAQLAR